MACATLKRSCEWDPLQSPGSSTPKRRRCGLLLSPVAKLNRVTPEKTTLPPDASPKLSSEQIAANIRDEIRKLQLRKQLVFDREGSTSPAPQSPGSSADPSSPLRQDKPMFSYQQVCLYCERMIKDRENKIRDEYTTILNAKLSEQYDTFLKFTYDQIHRTYGNSTPSYLS